MIPKVVKAKDGKGSGGNGFRGAVEYITKKTKHTIALRNLDNLSAAPRDMRAIAGPNANKPAYHMILSWAALEIPTDEQMVVAADAALARLGMSDHQAVIAVHRDRDHQHVHIIVNKVGFGGKVANLSHDFARLEKVCREIEHQQGWAQDRGRFEPEIRTDGTVSLKHPPQWREKQRKPTNGELGREQRTGNEPLAEHLKRDDVYEEVSACFDMARSWDELHQALEKLGLRYMAKGSGAKLVNAHDETDTASPSHVDKDWARSKLERRLGPLVEEFLTSEQAVEESPHSSLYKGLVAKLGPDLQNVEEKDGAVIFLFRSGAIVKDLGVRVSTDAGADDRTINAMIVVAQAKGWKSVRLRGSEEFRRRAAILLGNAGLAIQQPSQADAGKAAPRGGHDQCWTKYRAAQEASACVRHRQASERETLAQRHSQERAVLRAQQYARQTTVRTLFGGIVPFRAWDQHTRRLERQELRQRHQMERAELRGRHLAEAGVRIPDWRTWLSQMAQAGDPDAIKTIARQQARHHPHSTPKADRREELRREAEAMRRIDLPRLAESMGYLLDAKESTQKSLKYRRGGEVVIMAKAQDGTWSYFNGQAAGDQGGVYQFAQMRLGRRDPSPREICDFLRPHLDGADQATAPAEVPERDRDHTAARQAWQQAKASAPSYLAERGISKVTLQTFSQGDQVRQDRRGNALFAHHDQAGNLVGFEVKGPNWSGFAKGGQKALAIFGTPEAHQRAGQIVVTESGIDALSIAQIERLPDALYVSTGGSVGQRTIAELQALFERHPDATVLLGFDNDSPGDAFAVQVAQHTDRATIRLRPAGKDWNDDLRLKETATKSPGPMRISKKVS